MLLAIDTGGTKTLVTAFDRRGQVRGSDRFPTPKDHEEYIATISELISEQYAGKVIDAVVVGVPGVVRNNRLAWCENLPWNNVDIAAELKKIVKCPVWLENDANLAGLAETKAISKAPDVCLYVTISTGIGTGIITDGEIDRSLDDSEGGHIVLEYDGKLRKWEDFASGRAIRDTYGKYAREIHDKKTWQQIADKISRGFLTLIPTVQPDTIVIGGSIGTYYDMYGATLKRLLDERLPNHIETPKLRQAAHPEEAVVYGCYYFGTTQLDR